jgi:aspartyl-tRNA(Asn)/glutamyl-tRNA(Gln) amidotransferase subunit B
MAVQEQFDIVIGLEVHAELATHSKMFCGCPVVDSTNAAPNTSVCAVCAGMPGVLPVANAGAAAMAVKVGLALGCRINRESVFERKNYFYPDLPKGYQISQYQYPLAQEGKVFIRTTAGNRWVRINRVHMEEDAGKLTHVTAEDGDRYSLVDLNRAGVPLIEIVTEPDLHSVEEMDAYARELRAILRTLGVNSGDMEKGVIRFEANISVKPKGESQLGSRIEIKNLNSFRSMSRAVAHEIERQCQLLAAGGIVAQETRSFDELSGQTVVMRSKEDAHDYRYFPEPDLPPLVVEHDWVEAIRATLPELPAVRIERMIAQYQLTAEQAERLMEHAQAADLLEATLQLVSMAPSKAVLWILDGLFAWVNQQEAVEIPLTAEQFAGFLRVVESGEINRTSAQKVLRAMLDTGKTAQEIVAQQGFTQISDEAHIVALVREVLAAFPEEVNRYKEGKEELLHWFTGQVMRASRGRANPDLVRSLLLKVLSQPEK